MGENRATMICGTMIAAETTKPVPPLVCLASSFSASGSIAALANWNSTHAITKTRNAGS